MSTRFSLPSTTEARMDVRRPEGRRSRHVGALALLGAGLLSSCAPAPALRVALPSGLDTLDPHLHNNVSAYEVLSHVYEPLVRLDRHMPLRLRRHAGYWGPRPAVDEVELQLGARTAAIVPEVEAGRFGLLHLSAQDVLDAARRSARYVERTNPDVFVRHLGFDLARARTPATRSSTRPCGRPWTWPSTGRRWRAP